ncbi:RICIN domain-containing protein [Streptomyces swartbergensis]|uniref:RICIN domain-containing protein n=1 Tax=Streptomyces swartbergensis TaxID=487165 RepID=UPI00381479BE
MAARSSERDTDALINRNSGKAVEVQNASTADGTQLQLWDCNGGSNQKWTTLTAG